MSVIDLTCDGNHCKTVDNIMQFYLINLDRSADRCEWIKSQTDPLKIIVRRVPAVDGTQLSDAELYRWNAVKSDRFGMGPGEIGCFLSHRRAWQMVVDGTEPWAFVAEDDIHISSNIQHFLGGHDWIPADADLIKAETAKQRVWLVSRPASTAFGHRLHHLQSPHGGSAGYFLSRDAARRLLAATESFCSTLDQVLFNPLVGIAPQFKTYQLDPALCIQDWCLQPTDGGRCLESLLLDERQDYHGSKHKPQRRCLTWYWHKARNPIRKLTNAGLILAANHWGTHTVKKIPFHASELGLGNADSASDITASPHNSLETSK